MNAYAAYADGLRVVDVDTGRAETRLDGRRVECAAVHREAQGRVFAGTFDDGRAFCGRLVEAESVLLAPVESFGFPDRFRLGFGLPTDELREGLDRLGRFLERHG